MTSQPENEACYTGNRHESNRPERHGTVQIMSEDGQFTPHSFKKPALGNTRLASVEQIPDIDKNKSPGMLTHSPIIIQSHIPQDEKTIPLVEEGVIANQTVSQARTDAPVKAPFELRKRAFRALFGHSMRPDGDRSNIEMENARSKVKWYHEFFSSVWYHLRNTLFASPIMFGMALVPAGFAINYTIGPSPVSFVINFLAMIPTSWLASRMLRQMRYRFGDAIGGFLYITAGNLVQIVSSMSLLKSGQLEVLRTNLIGGILSSIMLVFGCAIIFGGMRRERQYFNFTVTRMAAVTLMLAITSTMTPTIMSLLGQTSDGNLTRQSRGAAIIMLILYACNLYFSFWTHYDWYNAPGPRTARAGEPVEEAEEEDREEIKLKILVVLSIFAVFTALLAFHTDFAVNSISAITEPGHLTPTFLGLILLPILNNDTEPLTLAKEDMMDLVVLSTVVKSVQTTLFVTPLMIIIGWGMGIDLQLTFSGFEVVSLFTAVLILNYLMMDDDVVWLHGTVLLGEWAMIALAAFYADKASIK